MPRPIITKKDNGNHDNPKNRAEDKLCPQLAKVEVEEEWFTSKYNLPKPPKEKYKYSR